MKRGGADIAFDVGDPWTQYAGGAYVPTFFVGMYAPFMRMMPPLTPHDTLSIANSERSCRKQNLQLDHGQSPGCFTRPRFTGLLCM